MINETDGKTESSHHGAEDAAGSSTRSSFPFCPLTVVDLWRACAHPGGPPSQIDNTLLEDVEVCAHI